MKKEIQKVLEKIIKDLYNLDVKIGSLDNPPKKDMGDYAFGTFMLAKDLKKAPPMIAEEIKNHIESSDSKVFESVSVAGPYLNIKINTKFFIESFLDFVSGDYLEVSDKKSGNVVVDYIGANVGKPLHIGHMCTPNIGSVIINLNRKFGYDVIGDSHIGDWGIIFGKLITAYRVFGEREDYLKNNPVDYLFELYVKFTSQLEKEVDREKENLFVIFYDTIRTFSKVKLPLPNDYSNGGWLKYAEEGNHDKLSHLHLILSKQHKVEYYNLVDRYKGIKFYDIENQIEEKIRDEFKKLSEGNQESIELWKSFTSHSIKAMRKQLSRMNVKPDYDIGESFYEGIGLPKMQDYPDLKWNMHQIVDELVEKGIATKNEDSSVGVVFPDESKLPSCILQKRNGTHGYLASDLACIKYRQENWNPEKIIYSVDVRQQLHFRQCFYIAAKAGWISADKLIHAYSGFISLKDGAMSTRKGRIIKLDKLLDEAEEKAKNIILEKRDDIEGEELENLGKIIGIGAIKYGYLKKTRESDVVFDWDEFMTFEGNSGPYIQYAYVRALRILEKVEKEIHPKDVNISEFGDLNLAEEEVEFVKLFWEYENTLVEALENNAPHLIAGYAYNLTKKFSSFYNAVSVINESDIQKKYIRLLFVQTFISFLEDAFALLGIDLPDKM